MIAVRKTICSFLLVLALVTTVAAQRVTRSVVGIATYYGKYKPGRRMANGQVFDENKLTAASRTLRLGSWARVTSLRTGKSVEVQITDRGPVKKDRIIDLSTAAARALGMISRGLDRVRVEPE